MRALVKITKALADRNRLLILLALSQDELCVCYFIEWLGLAPSTVSKHLSVLENADLVEVRREGRWSHYRLANPVKSHPAFGLFEWLLPALKTQVNQNDLMKKLATIRKRVDRREQSQTMTHPKLTRSKKEGLS